MPRESATREQQSREKERDVLLTTDITGLARIRVSVRLSQQKKAASFSVKVQKESVFLGVRTESDDTPTCVCSGCTRPLLIKATTTSESETATGRLNHLRFLYFIMHEM